MSRLGKAVRGTHLIAPNECWILGSSLVVGGRKIIYYYNSQVITWKVLVGFITIERNTNSKVVVPVMPEGIIGREMCNLLHVIT